MKHGSQKVLGLRTGNSHQAIHQVPSSWGSHGWGTANAMGFFILEMVHAPWIFLAMVSFFSGHVETCDFEFCRNHWFTMETADRRKHLSDKDRVGTQLKNNSADILIIWDAPLTYLNSQKYTSCSSPQTCECAIWVSGSFGLSMHFLLLAGDQT